MNFDNLNITPGNIIMMATISTLIIVAAVFSFVVPPIKEWRRKRAWKKATIEAVRKEDERIASLPRLDTQYFIKIPPSETRFARGVPRTFDTRYNRVVVYDDNGDGLLGLFMPSTFEGLHDGEYIQERYWVPFRGPGEMYAGEPVVIDRQKIDIYPIWMNPSHTNTAEWRRWTSIEKAFKEAYRGSAKYSDLFQIFTPWGRSDELRKKRRELEAMRASIAGKKKK